VNGVGGVIEVRRARRGGILGEGFGAESRRKIDFCTIFDL